MSKYTPVSLDYLWTIYVRRSVSSSVSEEQVLELKKAFYAGAGSALSNIIRACDTSSESGIKVIDGFLDECAELLKKALKKDQEKTSKCLRAPEVGWEKDVVLSIYADKAHAKNDTERLLERVINIGSEELWHGDCTCAFPVPGGSGKYYYKIEEHDLEKKPYVESEE